MYHIDGRIAATLNEVVEHVYLPTDKPFRWPSRLRAKADAHTDQLPAPARARNIDLEADYIARTAGELAEAGARDIGGGVFMPDDAVPAGHVPFSRIFRRVTTTLGWFSEGWPEFSDPSYAAAGGSGVVLEIRLRMHAFAGVGTAYALMPALVGAEHYIRLIMHNVVDVATGKAIASGYAAGALFDLNTRKLTKPEPAQMERLLGKAATALAPS